MQMAVVSDFLSNKMVTRLNYGLKDGKEVINVNVDFGKIELFDNESEGTFTGDISFILYKGDHYHLTIDTDWGEKLYVDTQDVWDLGDHVAITIPKENISFE